MLSVAVSIDGFIDDASSERLLLSNDADFDRIDQLRAESDAILVGAEAIRRDNPRLLVYSETRRAARVAAGKVPDPVKVTLTATGNLGSDLRFWHHGGDKLVYTTDNGAQQLNELTGLAEVVSLGATASLGTLLDDLGKRGIDRLMVEGGSRIHTQFLSAGLADELQMAIAPLIVGDAAAPRFLNPADYPGGSTRRMRLAGITQVGDVAVLRYLPKESAE